MLHSGHNEVEGVPVEVVRKRIRRINIRIGKDGTVCLSLPKWCYPPRRSRAAEGCGYSGATLREGEAFLREKWKWVMKTRAEVLARPAAPPIAAPSGQPSAGGYPRAPVTEAELEALRTLLDELNDKWSLRVREFNVKWEIRNVSSLWGSCRWGSRRITYNAELARAPRDLVEYVVVHEYTHFAVHDHGPKFYALMDERLPGWQTLRRRLNRREWGMTCQNGQVTDPHVPVVSEEQCVANKLGRVLTQMSFW